MKNVKTLRELKKRAGKQLLKNIKTKEFRLLTAKIKTKIS